MREQERESAGPRQYHVASAEGGGVVQVEGVTVLVVEVDVVVEVEVMVVLRGDGEMAYMLGGYSRGEDTFWESVERYSREAGWGPQGEMGQERAGHAAVLVPEEWCHLL